MDFLLYYATSWPISWGVHPFLAFGIVLTFLLIFWIIRSRSDPAIGTSSVFGIAFFAVAICYLVVYFVAARTTYADMVEEAKTISELEQSRLLTERSPIAIAAETHVRDSEFKLKHQMLKGAYVLNAQAIEAAKQRGENPVDLIVRSDQLRDELSTMEFFSLIKTVGDKVYPADEDLEHYMSRGEGAVHSFKLNGLHKLSDLKSQGHSLLSITGVYFTLGIAIYGSCWWARKPSYLMT